ncbi:inhibitory synaptic factor 1-like isoform X2 [Myxocyprinus asiaticus]|uniref:inhibitory synaptic factor 1-like isoform X2 n=1 Tax=Myxocyprinus asiaticus TaxID=70543 RepID=UPI002223BAD1|nr:inhibitory synaptic factor 1-like isoform X2 [Myxocyprinus asiaticus]
MREMCVFSARDRMSVGSSREIYSDCVVAQIDKLTSDIDLDLEDEDHGKSLGDLFHTETLSDKHDLSHLQHNPLLDTARNPTTAKNRELDLYGRSCGDLPALNGPLKAPNSPKTSWVFGSGGRIHYYDKTLYHALCCDDDYDEDRGGLRSSRLSSTDSVFSSSPTRFLTPRSTRKTYSSPESKKTALCSCSTQTVSDKSTQTHFPYIPAKQRPSSDYKN